MVLNKKVSLREVGLRALFNPLEIIGLNHI